MKTAWIASPLKDSVWILSPPFVVTLLAVLFHGQLGNIEARYSWWTWLVLVVCVDVAHVYASLFRTYLIPAEWARRKRLYVGIPVLCLAVAVALYAAGEAVFWSVLAYVAVFHFVRQQWGLMRLYARFETKTKLSVGVDALAIYTATLYPMLYWVVANDRQFVWFVAGEFVPLASPRILPMLSGLYALVVAVYALRVWLQWRHGGGFNVPKNLLVVGTFLSWYVGIVHYNHPLVFTLLNVVSHGVPYVALVYFTDVAGKQHHYTGLGRLWSWQGLLVYVAVLLGLALVEESVWELLVWGEHLGGGFVVDGAWMWLVVPLLALPQLTHYVLDGFIWRKPKPPLPSKW